MDKLSNILAPDPTIGGVRSLLNVEPDCEHGYIKEASLRYCAICLSALLGLALSEIENRSQP